MARLNVGRFVLVAASALGSAGCPTGPKDPAPPEETSALASAAPGALGALAAGTDAAPPVVLTSPEAPGYDTEGAIPFPGSDGGFGTLDAGTAPTDELPL